MLQFNSLTVDLQNFSDELFLLRFRRLGVIKTKDFVCGELFKRRRKEMTEIG